MQNEKQNQTIKRVAAYIRVSTHSEEQENSFEIQRAYFDEYLKSHTGLSSAGIYADYDVSGTTIKKREGMQALLLSCKKGRVDRIICKSISRFSRNALEFLQIIQILNENGVTAFFEKENLDTGKALNDIVVTALAAIAEEESISISENIIWANKKRYVAGEVPNETIYGYRWADSYTVMASGYKYRNVALVPEEAEIVKKVFEFTANGMNCTDIACWLNAHGVVPPLQKDSNIPCKKWRIYHITEIVSSARYCGCVMTQKTFTSDPLKHKIRRNYGELDRHYIHNHHPAIVTKELFELVQVIRQQNCDKHGSKRYGAKHLLALSGLLICPKCGRNLNCNGRTHIPYWFCPDDCRTRIEEWYVFELLKAALFHRFGGGDDFQRNLIRMYDEIDHKCAQRTQVNNELIAVKSRIITLENKIAVLENKALNTPNRSAKVLFSESLISLKNTLRQENKDFAVLQCKAAECSSMSSRGLGLFDIQQEIIHTLEENIDFEKNIEKILHNNIGGIIAKVIFQSADKLTVYWLDNSTTKVIGGHENE